MSQLPLVSIICLCYNHEQFLREALNSVLQQTYPNIEVIVVDDMSTDGSVSIIAEYLREYPGIKFISTEQNIGNCAAFNLGWRASSGAYIIDFATDDVLLPERVTQQVEAFSKLGKNYGVVYSDAEYINDEGAHLYNHSQKYKPAPDGDVFAEVLGRYFICPPTMLIRREVFEELNGYDPSLAYEDFDFWIRSARSYKYSYLDKITTKRRIHHQSLSQRLYKKGDRMLASTVRVCEKAAALVRTAEERKALSKRLQYEGRQAFFTGNFYEAEQLLTLLKRECGMPVFYQFLYLLNRCKIHLGFLRKVYLLCRR